MFNKVIWSEGMFLQPQHFQQHDRYLEYLLQQRPTALGWYAYGISKLTIDHTLLPLGKIAITNCKGVFPDGTTFDIPHDTPMPLPLDVPLGLNNTIVYLALPLNRCNASPTNVGRYQTTNIEVNDEHANHDVSASVQVGKLAVSLMLEIADQGGYTRLAIARIKESQVNHKIILDEDFIPTCIDVHSTVVLQNFLTELIALLNYRGALLAQKIINTKQESIAEISNFMLLQLINSFTPKLIHYANTNALHPEKLYRLLITLMGELATFTNSEHRPITLCNYQHDNLCSTYQPLMDELRRSLTIVSTPSAIAIPLTAQPYGLWTTSIIDKNLLAAATFVLLVHADMPLEEIQTRIPSQTKISSIEQISNLIAKALPGVPLKALAVAPRQIPYYANYSYFMLDKQHQHWRTIELAGDLAIHIIGNFTGLKLELWAIREE